MSAIRSILKQINKTEMKKKQHVQKLFKPLISLGLQSVVPGTTISGNVVPMLYLPKQNPYKLNVYKGFRYLLVIPLGK